MLGWGGLVLESIKWCVGLGGSGVGGCYKVYVSRLLGWGGLVLESVKWYVGLGGSGVGVVKSIGK